MSGAELASRVLLVENFCAVRKNDLRGYVKVTLPTGMAICDVAIYVSTDQAWAAPPMRPRLSREGVAMRDGAGKIRYDPVVTFASRELRDRFSEAVVSALRLTRPEVFEP